MRCCAVICVHDDNVFLQAALRAVETLPRLVLVSRIDWTGRTGAWEKSVEIAEACGAEVEVGDWTENDHRERWLAAPWSAASPTPSSSTPTRSWSRSCWRTS